MASVCELIKTILSNVGLLLAVIIYAAGGGLLFEMLEATNEVQSCERAKYKYEIVLNATVDVVWDTVSKEATNYEKISTLITKLDTFRGSVQNGTFAGNLTQPCEEIERTWDFYGSTLFSVTVMTTIGYGHIAPKTYWGRMIVIAYAMPGIPLLLMMLANIGDFFAKIIRIIYYKVCCINCCRRKRDKVSRIHSSTPDGERSETVATSRSQATVIDDDESVDMEVEEDPGDSVTIPLTVTLLIIAFFIFMGALVFHFTEDNWTLTEASYFAFVTVSTIGFGDYVPGQKMEGTRGNLMTMAATVYMILGMSMLPLTFALLGEEIADKAHWVGLKLGFIKPYEQELYYDESSDEDEDLTYDPERLRAGEKKAIRAGEKQPQSATDKSKRESAESRNAKRKQSTVSGVSSKPRSGKPRKPVALSRQSFHGDSTFSETPVPGAID